MWVMTHESCSLLLLEKRIKVREKRLGNEEPRNQPCTKKLTIIYGFVIVVSNIFWLNLRVKTKKKKLNFILNVVVDWEDKFEKEEV